VIEDGKEEHMNAAQGEWREAGKGGGEKTDSSRDEVNI
jgi:hypothetical protein